MKLNKLIAKALTLAVTISVLVLPVAAFAEEAAGEQPPSVASQKDQIEFTHKHTSQRYGYSIFCPVKPKVIPASAYNEQDREMYCSIVAAMTILKRPGLFVLTAMMTR